MQGLKRWRDDQMEAIKKMQEWLDNIDAINTPEEVLIAVMMQLKREKEMLKMIKEMIKEKEQKAG